LFTIFPSLYEGWGLPVTESLAHGKPCLVARTTSLPEAGGALARYFDPDNLHEAVDAVRTLIGDRAGIAAWEAEIRARFRPTPWRETAMALLDFMEKIADLP
jgi:glycosyltransferase involved in cell wall biosynthesis